jgi:hypothetical protein
MTSADDRVGLQHFMPLLGQRFTFAAEGVAPWEAELHQARGTGGVAYQGREPFTLLFRGPPQVVRPQMSYRLAGGPQPVPEIFLVPVAANADGVNYEAVFA